MRLLHVTDVYTPQIGGIELFVRDLAARQAAAGHEVAVLTPTPNPYGDEVGPVEVFRAGPTRKVAAGRKIVLSGDWDVVHAHLSVLSPFSSLVGSAAAAVGVPLVNTVHSLWAGRTPVVRAAGAVAHWGTTPAVWTGVSGVAAEQMRAVLRDGTPVRVVPNAVDVAWWRAGLDEPGAAVDPTAVTIVSVMRLVARKRPLHLLRVLREVRRQVPPEIALRAVIVGAGPLEPRLRQAAARWGLADWVSLPGRLDREAIRALYREADVYVAPAFQESFGIAALEARAAGLPVVAMQSGGVGEFIQDGVEGRLCRDDQDLARVLADLAADAFQREVMTATNLASPPDFDWARALDGFASAYAEAMGTRRAIQRTGTERA